MVHLLLATLERFLCFFGKKAGTMYKVAKVLGLSKVATYRWVKKGRVPPQRVKSLMLLKPEWFEDKVEEKVENPV